MARTERCGERVWTLTREKQGAAWAAGQGGRAAAGAESRRHVWGGGGGCLGQHILSSSGHIGTRCRPLPCGPGTEQGGGGGGGAAAQGGEGIGGGQGLGCLVGVDGCNAAAVAVGKGAGMLLLRGYRSKNTAVRYNPFERWAQRRRAR